MVFLQRVLGVLIGVLFIAGVLIFASIAVGVLLAVALVVWAWLWWKGRSLKRPSSSGGAVIEGEYRDVSVTERIEERHPR